MSTGELLGLGGLAGLTIFLGLPFGRMRDPAPRLKAFLNASATGILVFLLWDVLSKAWDPVTRALDTAKAGTTSWPYFAGLAAIFALGLGTGLVSLVYYDRWMAGRAHRRIEVQFRPGAAAVKEFEALRHPLAGLSEPRRLATLIAVGIGLHNFSEGLAIGQSAAKGEISLA